jgi:hypothetical protein
MSDMEQADVHEPGGIDCLLHSSIETTAKSGHLPGPWLPLNQPEAVVHEKYGAGQKLAIDPQGKPGCDRIFSLQL